MSTVDREVMAMRARNAPARSADDDLATVVVCHLYVRCNLNALETMEQLRARSAAPSLKCGVGHLGLKR